MPFYIFLREPGGRSWELLEVVKPLPVAEQALAEYRGFLKDDAPELALVEADSLAAARAQLAKLDL